jgi:hypothetical protein
MLKFIFPLSLFIGLAAISNAQKADSLLKHKRYNAIAANGFVQEIHAAGDSIVIAYKQDSVFKGRDVFGVVSVIPRGEYNVAIVKMAPGSLTLMTPNGKRNVKMPLYGVFVFRFEKEDSRALLLHDGRLWLTANEAANAYAAIRLQGEYFNIWYSSDRFARFVNYPSLNDADSVTVEKVALDWIKKITEHRAKKLNTYTTDRYGADYGRDNLTKVLVNNHLSPLGTPADFDRKLKQYHLKLMPELKTPPNDSIPGRQRQGKTGTTISD